MGDTTIAAPSLLLTRSSVRELSRRRVKAMLATAIAVSPVALAKSAIAASATWLASPTDSTWEASGSEDNWSTGTATFPGSTSATTSTDVATFTGTSTQQTITISSSSLNIGSIIFGGATGATAGAYTIGVASGTNPLLLTNGGFIIDYDTQASSIVYQTINAPLTLENSGGGLTGSGAYSFVANGTGTSGTEDNFLLVNGSVTGNAASGSTSTLTLTGNTNTRNIAAANQVAGTISDGSNGGELAVAVGYTSSGSTTWILSGTNTYSGGTTLSGTAYSGGLALGSSSALGTGALVVSGASNETLSAYAAGLVVNNAITFNTSTRLSPNGYTLTLGGTLAGTATSNVTLYNSGTLVLTGSNTYSGGTTLTAGTLAINYGGSSSSNSAIGTGSLVFSGGTIANTSGSPVTLATNNALTLNQNVTFIGTSDLNLGAGAVSLGTTATATRTITVDSNTLTIGGAISNGTASTTPTTAITIAGSGTLALSGSNTYTGATTISTGTLVLSGNNTAATGATSVTAGAALELLNTANALAGSGLTINSTTTATSTLALRANSATTFTNGTVAQNSVTENIALIGQDTAANSGFNFDVGGTASGATTLTAGGVVFQGGNSSTTGDQLNVVNTSGSTGRYTLALGNLVDDNLSNQAQAIYLNPTSADLSVGSITGSTANGTGVFIVGTGTTSVTGSLVQGGTRTINLNMNGTGSLVLSGGSSNSGAAFNLNGGTTLVDSSNGLKGTFNHLGNPTAASAAPATLLLGGSDAAGLTGGLTLTNAFAAEDTTTGAITIGGQNSSGTNTYSGNITLGATANTGKSVTLVAANGGEVDFTGNILPNGTDTSAGVTIGDTSGLQDGAIRLAGADSYHGTTSITSGTLTVDASSAGSNTAALSGTSAVTVGGTGGDQLHLLTVSGGIGTGGGTVMLINTAATVSVTEAEATTDINLELNGNVNNISGIAFSGINGGAAEPAGYYGSSTFFQETGLTPADSNSEGYFSGDGGFDVVPEPGCVSVLVIGGLALTQRRRRTAVKTGV